MRSCLLENGQLFGTRLSRVQESSRWQDGQKAKEILLGDEFSMTILLYSCCLLTKFFSRRIMMIADDSYSGSIVSILNISCDVSRYNIHDYCLSGDVSRYDIHD